MSIIKPGKLRVVADPKQAQRRLSEETFTQTHEIWEDYNSGKKSGKKREYERGSGNRMVRKEEEQVEPTAPESLLSDEEIENYKPRTDIEQLEEKLGYAFKDKDFLGRALTHRSALGAKERVDYERLEFLGDAVLDLTVAHLLSDHYPDAREGELSKMRAALVNTQALAEIAKRLEVGPFIKLGRGELASGGFERPSILADVMEAIVGAMYRDSDFDTVFAAIKEIYGGDLEEVTPYDPKTELQEVLHAAGSEPPSYLLEMVEGPEHAPTFVTVVMIDGEIGGRGRSSTKKASQQLAAAEALIRMVATTEALELVEGQTAIITELLLLPPETPKSNGKKLDGDSGEGAGAEETSPAA